MKGCVINSPAQPWLVPLTLISVNGSISKESFSSVMSALSMVSKSHI